MEKIYNDIALLGKKFGASEIKLFGSRARKDNRERSDIDIAVFGMSKSNQLYFTESVEALPTLLDFDIVFISEKTDLKLLENIKKDGITLMNKFEEKYSKLCEAVKRLNESINDYKNTPLSSIRDGVIQRFEFCTELAWKTAREYLINQGYVDINSPKSVMKQAYSDGLIKDEAGWLELLNARNITSHIYDEETAKEIFNNVKNKYCKLFEELIIRFA